MIKFSTRCSLKVHKQRDSRWCHGSKNSSKLSQLNWSINNLAKKLFAGENLLIITVTQNMQFMWHLVKENFMKRRHQEFLRRKCVI